MGGGAHSKWRWKSHGHVGRCAQCKSGEAPRGVIALEHCRVTLTVDNQLLIATPSTPPERLAAQRGQTQLLWTAPTNFELHTWLRKLRIASRCPWESADADACTRCRAGFSLLARPHHCRRCGVVVCDACSPTTQTMVDYAYDAPVRVCKVCAGATGPVPPPLTATEALEAAAAAGEAEEGRLAAEREAELARRAKARADSDAAAARRAKLKAQFAAAGGGGSGGSGRR